MNKRSSLLVMSAVLITFTLLILVPNLYGMMSFRCGTKLVQVGDKQSDVLSKCGQPTSQAEGRLGTGGSDRWTYNRGSTQAMVVVRFVGGKVSSIESAERGFVQPTFQQD
jgi:hypothetical protein